VMYAMIANLALITRKVVEEWLSEGGKYVLPAVDEFVIYYKNNQRNPRLFSGVFKQIMYK
jgi:hypothetical protein